MHAGPVSVRRPAQADLSRSVRRQPAGSRHAYRTRLARSLRCVAERRSRATETDPQPRLQHQVEKLTVVAPGGGAGVKLARGEHLRLIDIEGGQTGDLMAFSLDGRARLSNGRSFDYNG